QKESCIMASRSKSPTARLTLTLDRELKELIETAACASEKNVQEFAAAILIENARRVLREYRTTVLTGADAEAFVKILESDAEPNDALKRAAERYKHSVVKRKKKPARISE